MSLFFKNCKELSCLTKKSVESKPIDKDHEVTELICPICLESVKNVINFFFQRKWPEFLLIKTH